MAWRLNWKRGQFASFSLDVARSSRRPYRPALPSRWFQNRGQYCHRALWIVCSFHLKISYSPPYFSDSFNTHYRRYIHFFQPAISAPNIFKRSPFLFWTMILISSRANEHHPEIHDELLPGFDKFLAPVCQRPIRQIETIHALLLLCLWPVPRPRTSKNPTQDYLSLARDTAMQLNCHQISAMDSAQSRLSGFRDRTAESAANEAKARTWLGYVYVDTLWVRGFQNKLWSILV